MKTTLAEQIADCEYHITIAQMGYTSQSTKRKWLNRLKKLQEQLKTTELWKIFASIPFARHATNACICSTATQTITTNALTKDGKKKETGKMRKNRQNKLVNPKRNNAREEKA